MHPALKTTLDKLRQNDHSKAVALSQLKGGLTNKIIRLDIGADAYVVSIDTGSAAALGIDRDSEYHNSHLAFQYGIGPEVVLRTSDAIVTRFVEGKIFKVGDLTAHDKMSLVMDALHRCHQIPLKHVKGSYNVFRAVKQHSVKIQRMRHKFSPRVERVLDILGLIQKAFNQQTYIPVFCHNDTVPQNMIQTGKGLILLDWEYSGIGDRFFDLGMLAAYHNLEEFEEEQLIEDYFGFFHKGALARLRLMRAMSDLRDATWGIVQSQYSSLEFDFETYSLKRLNKFERITSRIGFTKLLNIAASKARISALRKE